MRPKNSARLGAIETEIVFSVRVTGQYMPGQGTADLKVFAGQHDITDALSKYQLQTIGTDFEEAMRDEEEYHGE
jgi:hypothetical protein